MLRTSGTGSASCGAPPAALGLVSFQMLRYQFWGFTLFTFALYSKNLVEGGDATRGARARGRTRVRRRRARHGARAALEGLGAPDPPAARSMRCSAPGRSCSPVTLAGFAALLFSGFFAFFVGKISADTIMQQAMPDDFRGRAFALFDIAYNLGFIVPALILSFVWVENDPGQVRTILVVRRGVPRAHRARLAVVAVDPERVRAAGRRRGGGLVERVPSPIRSPRPPRTSGTSSASSGTTTRPTPGHRRRCVARADPEAGARVAERPEPDEWSVLECLGHATDAELVASSRYRWILAHDEPPLIGYDQDLWVDRLNHAQDDPEELLATFEALRRANLALWARRPRRSGRARRAHRARAGELRPHVHGDRRPRPVPPGPGATPSRPSRPPADLALELREVGRDHADVERPRIDSFGSRSSRNSKQARTNASGDRPGPSRSRSARDRHVVLGARAPVPDDHPETHRPSAAGRVRR